MRNKKLFCGLLAGFAALVAVCQPIKSRLASAETGYLSPLPPLPHGAIPVEYIESSGTQYIDTGVAPDSNTGITLDFQVVQYNDGCCGIYRNNPYRLLYCNFFNSKMYYRYGNYQSAGTSEGLNVFGRNYLVMSDGKCVLNGIVVVEGCDTSSLDRSIDTFIMFAYSRNGTITGFCKLRCYGFSMTHGEEDILSLIPVRFPNELGEWEGAMYDFTSGELFRNQGTGSFVIGPDL